MSYNGARPKERKKTSVKSTYNLERQDTEDKISSKDELCAFYHHLSIRLYDVLSLIGASAEFRKLRQDCSISKEILMTISDKVNQLPSSACYIFGSSSEGTTIPSLNSDLDILTCIHTPVVENLSEVEEKRSLLMIRDTHTQPGYVKLQRVLNGKPQTVYTREKDWNYHEEYDNQGRICVNHMIIPGDDRVRNGPADTDTDLNMDSVKAYMCSTVPQFAREWITRARKHRWPTANVLKKMTTMGCFVVGVGHPESKERNIEWRLSFSLQERELMFCMNLTQHKCYVLLKMIKKDLIEPIVGKSISSYHLKTCMLYVIENTRLSFWKRRNLVLCILLCVCVLFKWVYTGYCPNYFITEENMFDRTIHRSQRIHLLHQISLLLSNGCGFLFRIKLENMSDLLKNSMSNVHLESKMMHFQLEVKLSLLTVVFSLRQRMSCLANQHKHAINYVSMIMKYIYQTKSIADYNEQRIHTSLSYILPYVHLQLAQSCASQSLSTYNTEATLDRLYCQNLQEGRHCDLTSSILLEATVFLKFEQYERCIGVLDRLELVFDKNPLRVCKCHNHKSKIQNKKNKKYLIIEELLSDLSASEIVARTSSCISFLKSDMSIAPEALKYEMLRTINTPLRSRNGYEDEWFNMAVIDANVYLHFLQYLVHAKLHRRISKDIAVHKLVLLLECEINLAHRETGYNLLGWIYLHEKCAPRAIRYFKKSWAIRPHHNAAKLHMLTLIRDINS